MAIKELCDGGCGRESPNKIGDWIGNDWLEVDILDRREKSIYRDATKRRLVCKKCAAEKTLNEILKRR